MVRMETAVQYRQDRVLTMASLLAPNLDIKKFRQISDDFTSDLEATSSLREYALFYAREKEMARERTVAAMMKAFERMEKDGTIEAFRARVERERAEIRARKPQSSFS